MSSVRRVVVVAMAFAIVAATGCGLGPGESEEGAASLRVTRDHGAELVAEATTEDPSASETVVRMLDREAEIETSYGGNFVDSIDGISSTVRDGHSLDWYFYVNGYWSPVGAGEATVHAGDRIWWDYRDWSGVIRVPAVVGSYPEPFRSGFNGRKFPTELVCFRSGETTGACDAAAASLRDAGADLTVSPASEADADPAQSLRVLVGDWQQLRADPTARSFEAGPERSGVYAKPIECEGGGWALQAFDADPEAVGSAGRAAWVATVLDGADQPTWIVSATSAEQLPDAAAMLDQQTLEDAYAVASFDDGEPVRLPASAPPNGATGGC